jgi:hypothetical protein
MSVETAATKIPRTAKRFAPFHKRDHDAFLVLLGLTCSPSSCC